MIGYSLICYDVSDDQRRGRLHSLLRRYGYAVEESVFEVYLTPRQLRELRRGILRHIDRHQDTVRIYPLCHRCSEHIEVVAGPPRERRPVAHVI